MRIKYVFLSALFFLQLTGSAQLLPYKNPQLPVETRVNDLLNRMSPTEKFWQLFMIPGDLDKGDSLLYQNGIFGFQVSAGNRGDAGGQMLKYNTTEEAAVLAKKINRIQGYFVNHTRLGIPMIAFDEALHGLVREGATVFPQAIALAATWDSSLVNRVATSIAAETKQRGIRQILSPVINIATDPRWGRTEETYGEDPYLSAVMGVQFIKAFESNGIISTPKHFVANAGDGGRDSYPIHANERLLEEIHFPPFFAAIKRAGSRSIMTAYNSLDGTAASANRWLLTEKLKKEWGFKGFVISDANAVGGEVVLHNTAKDYATSGKHAIEAGLDVIFQTEYKHHQLFMPPFLNGNIDTSRINDAVSRVLRAKFELGLFEQPYVSEEIVSFPSHMNIAKEAALKSFVLLKNQPAVLPLSTRIRQLAIIGTDAKEARMGGYSGPANHAISILEGISQKLGKEKVVYHPGCGRSTESYTVIQGDYLSHDGQKGLAGAYFNNVTLSGNPFLQRTDETINFRWTLFGPATGMDADFYAIRWTGQLLSPVTGTYQIGLEGNNGYRLYINNRLIIDNWIKQGYSSSLKDFAFVKGRKYDIHIEFYEPRGNASIKLVWNVGISNNWQQLIREAVRTAATADAIVFVAGITEGEFQDRAYLSLPGHQEEQIKALAATGKPLIVLLSGGSAITMQQWMDKAAAIASIWYPGEQGGSAIADIIFGEYNPTGRLPITWPMHESQLPLIYHHKPTGRGDDYNNLSGQPLFPFGYGLSYTSFEYGPASLSAVSLGQKDSIQLSFVLKNTGKRDGEEVVQLYIRDHLASVARPLLALKGFQRVALKAGEEKKVSLTIHTNMLSMLDAQMKEVTEPGEFSLLIGASAADIRIKEKITLQ